MTDALATTLRLIGRCRSGTPSPNIGDTKTYDYGVTVGDGEATSNNKPAKAVEFACALFAGSVTPARYSMP